MSEPITYDELWALAVRAREAGQDRESVILGTVACMILTPAELDIYLSLLAEVAGGVARECKAEMDAILAVRLAELN